MRRNFRQGALSRWAIAIAALVPLTGCHWFSDDKGFFVDRSKDYVKARPGPSTEVPEGLSSTAIGQQMAVPALPPDAAVHIFADGVPRPEAIYAREEADTVRIQKLGDRRWVLVPQSPAVVWPKVKQFFADNGVAVVGEDPDSGVIETAWLTPADAQTKDVIRLAVKGGRETASIKSGRDRLLVKVEPGIRERTTEVYLRDQNDSIRMPTEGMFPAASDVPQVEAEVINELASYVASNVADESVSFVARQISTQSKAELVRTDQNQPALRLTLDFNRAWALITQALSDAKVPVKDVDRSAGVVYAEVSRQQLQGEQKRGWFMRMFAGGDKKRPVQIKVTDKGTALQVLAFEADGATPLTPDLAEQLLLLIREYAT